MKRSSLFFLCLSVLVAVAICPPATAQTITATLEGVVLDSSGAALPGAAVTAVNTSTGLSRSVEADQYGNYRIGLLPPGEYEVTTEKSGFTGQAKKINLEIGQAARLDFSLAVGELTQEVVVEAGAAVLEPTRTEVSSVIVEQQIDTLPVNGRQFIDFALLAPGVTVGETTAGSTDVIIEPVTKLSFAGQNIHYNLVAVDGADNISTASGVQKTTPSQEAVQEFRVINTKYSVEAGRAVAGIVNIITKSGGNDWHGSGYWFFRNDKLDANSILSSPDPQSCAVPGDVSSGGCRILNKLRQNQFGGTLGGPLVKDRLFIFGNYEGQRRRESPFYTSAILENIDVINTAKTTLFGSLAAGAPGTLPAENLNVTKTFDYDQFLVRADAQLSPSHFLFVRYFYNKPELLNVSPLNNGFDLPSAFKDNFFRDQTLVGSLNSTLTPSLLNDLRVQYARRFFDFPTVTTQPHLEVANTFAIGVNRGNPDFYKEPRFEIADSMTWTKGKHSIQFGGNFNWVETEESFPLFYPFEATFVCVSPDPANPGSICNASNLAEGRPVVFFWQKNDAASGFTETTIDPAVYQGSRISEAIRNQAKGTLRHTYNGFFIQDKWRATPNLTLNFGVRYEWETWPEVALDSDLDNVDPRFGFAYNFGTSRNVVLRGGAGLFHGIIPSNLLACQRPSCGGILGPFPGRENVQDALDAATRVGGYVPLDPFLLNPDNSRNALLSLLNGTYPQTSFNFGVDPITGVELDGTVVRFVQNHQAPYGIQMSLALEFEPFKDATFSASYLRVKGNSLSSFYNINQPPDGTFITASDSRGNTGQKEVFFDPITGGPGAVDPRFLLYFEATDRWRSVYDGLLVELRKRPTGHLGLGLSYTWSKSIDDGPNPSFVLIPQNSQRLDLERAISADHIKHRFVGNATIIGPTDVNPLVNDFEFGVIVSLQSARFQTIFAGLDANGDGFPINDRVGIEPRNTFKGDAFYSFDARVSRSFPLGEKARVQFIAEAFNIFNTLNVRFFNTVYGAPDFIPGGPGLLGSPLPSFGTPAAIFNPRQVQFALKFTF